MTTIPQTSLNGHASSRLTDPASPGNVANAPDKTAPIKYPAPVLLETFYYVSRVPRDWQSQTSHSASPRCIPPLEYSVTAEITAALNRATMKARIDSDTVYVWYVCVPRKKMYSTLRIQVPNGWSPIDEYDMPPTGLRGGYSREDRKKALGHINSVIGNLKTGKATKTWAIAACPIRPDYVKYYLEQRSKRTAWKPLFNVITTAGDVLQAHISKGEAHQFADKFNSLNQHSETEANVVQAI
ncbi:hypothetical protein Pla110_29140 [Polystyrenella longa]|uniref:Uncharacterized protein n=1 Tax=Polystyrenella longa TaxID=2528007 RepID=A0A518CPL4_9PLAN|nr:hypothetical protein [Polystyrenella longa]QDU81176.1 hypothetical protein Pla110_29140 [Polystyrenella longa]